MTESDVTLIEPLLYKAPQRLLSAALCHVLDAWCIAREYPYGQTDNLYEFATPGLAGIRIHDMLEELHSDETVIRQEMCEITEKGLDKWFPAAQTWTLFAITEATLPITDKATFISLLPSVRGDDEDINMVVPPSARIRALSSQMASWLNDYCSNVPGDTEIIAAQYPFRLENEEQWSVEAPNPLSTFRGTLPLWQIGKEGYSASKCRYFGSLTNMDKPDYGTYLWGCRATAELIRMPMVQRLNLMRLDGNPDLYVHHECVAFPGVDGYRRAEGYIAIQAQLIANTLKVYPDTAFNRTLFHSSSPGVYAMQPRSGVYGVRSVPLADKDKDCLTRLKGMTLFRDVILKYGTIPPPISISPRDSLLRCLIDQHKDDIIGQITKDCWE